jgi:hypothetical protein
VTFSQITGWTAAAVVIAAGSVPLGHRLLAKKRAAIGSGTIRSHVIIGTMAAAASFAHGMAILPSLGSPEAIGAGVMALLPGAVAFLLLIAHVGVGLRLRQPKLKERPKVRRTHFAFACAIWTAIAAHVVMLLRSG